MRYAPILVLISAGCASITLGAPLPEADAGSSSNPLESLSIRDAGTHSTESNSETHKINLSDNTSDVSTRGVADAGAAAAIVGICIAGFIAKFHYKDEIKAAAARTRARVGAIFGGSSSDPHGHGRVPRPRLDWSPPMHDGETWNIEIGSNPPSPVPSHHSQTVPTSSSPPTGENGGFEVPLPPGANPQDYYMHPCNTAQ